MPAQAVGATKFLIARSNEIRQREQALFLTVLGQNIDYSYTTLSADWLDGHSFDFG